MMISAFSASTERLHTSGKPARARKKEAERPDGLEFPQDGVALARNERPVILLHGTLVEKEGIEAYRDFSLRQGHPVDHRTYPSITKGHKIEKSAELASRNINSARFQLAQRNVAELENATPEKLKDFFQLDGALYGKLDSDAERIGVVLPQLVADVAQLLGRPEPETTLSGELSRLQERVASDLEVAGVASSKAKKAAAELLDSIAPKAIVVGHSAGGYVGYAMTVNAEAKPDKDPFTYDGGNGIGQMLVISSPVGQGLPSPAPPGVLDLGFSLVDTKVLQPLENLPPSQLALAFPPFAFGYAALKGLTKQAYHAANWVSLSLANPVVNLTRPSNAQVVEGSEFFNTYIKDRPVPEGVSVIAVTSPLDQLSQEARSQVDDNMPNAHNFSANLEVSKEQLERERATWSHVIMTEKPDLFKQQFAQHLLQPGVLSQVLHPSNDDGVRYEALQMVGAQLEKDPSLGTAEIKKALRTVADERAPFRDSPSSLAHQLLG